MTKAQKKKKKNTTVSSKALEGVAFEELLPSSSGLQNNSKITELIKDCDFHIDKIIELSGWKIPIIADPNHLLKNFMNNFENFVKPQMKNFRGIGEKILKQLKYILYDSTEKTEKYKQIQDMRNYILTKPFLKFGRSRTYKPWKYSSDNAAVKCLDDVIDYCNQICFIRSDLMQESV
ncbi:hypothetical protein M9Y10_026388 [Tritrichomonas musculus]|uniref:Uncharacterized protein n=1 Tax=Tritrichomonas musculus TaxID=1915356 RepID=A0ABR2H7H7_9EUKA